MHQRGQISLILFLIPILAGLTACTREVDERYWTPPAYLEPSVTPASPSSDPTTPEAATPTPFQLPPTRDPNSPILMPTPDSPHGIPTPLTVPESYIVEPGDTIGIIARKFGLRAEAILQANSLVNPNYLEVGQVLALPSNSATSVGPAFKIIPDSELIFGPFNMIFDTGQFIQSKGGYLSSYAEEVDGKMMTGA
ncbi:MAG: LysM peptidoglycan-binding domain-containing protein, partial [Anaerolineaceae bacterium]|nr:LysM peptidoglycan-binding domain-containing protein [Anaerolineaceae bacterium]